MSRWFRVYDDAMHDPRVQSLPPRLFKFWFNLLCVASKNDGVIPPLSDLKELLKVRLDYVKDHLKELLERGLVDEIDGRMEPHNWRKRQYKSDVSTPRVKAHREAAGNVSETPPENRVQRTDTEKKDRLHASVPDRGKRLDPDWKPTERNVSEALAKGLTPEDVPREAEKFRDHFLAAPGQRGVKRDWDAAWRNWAARAAEMLGRPLRTAGKTNTEPWKVVPGSPQFEAWRTHFRDRGSKFMLARFEQAAELRQPVAVGTEWPPNYVPTRAA